MSYWIKAYDIVQDKIPKWVVLKSYVAFLFAVAFFIIVVLFLPFQDKISGRVTIYTSGKPVQLLAPQKGNLRLFASDAEQVEKGQVIGIVQYNITPNKLETIRSFIFNDLVNFNPSYLAKIDLQLEELITDDSHPLNSCLIGLHDAITQYNRSLILNAPEREITATRSLQQTLASRLPELEKTAELYSQSIAMLKEQLSQDSLLLQEGGISKREYENRRITLLEDLRSQLDIISEQKKIKALIAGQEATVAALEDQYSKNADALFGIIPLKVQELRTSLNQIILNNVIIAPINGELSLHPSTVQYGDVELGHPIGSISSTQQEQNHIAIASLKRQNTGNIIKGMKVHLYLEDFPAREYGIISGVVNEIREVPTQEDSELYIDIELPLVTSYKESLPIQKKYTGRAEVVIDRLNLLQILSRELKYSKDKMSTTQ